MQGIVSFHFSHSIYTEQNFISYTDEQNTMLKLKKQEKRSNMFSDKSTFRQY